MVTRGEVWWADLGDPQGSAPALRRPVVVLSADAYNASSIATVTVVAITRMQRLAALPGNVALPADISRLPDASVVNVTQLATIAKAALDERVSQLPPWAVTQIEQGVRRALGLGA
ncbi:MAG: type II toxin-antitoxin system PemK/MazF family toxin [Patulibacter sp.]|nr:type II toxin-antitoxin system PemK/MazF family toxin [Patulibacter sp.]